MANEKKYTWKAEDGSYINMRDMDPKHLQHAHTHACSQEYRYHILTGFFCDLRDQLEEIAKLRGIALRHPDETHPSERWGHYFEVIRKIKATPPVALTRKSLGEYQGLEQVNILG